MSTRPTVHNRMRVIHRYLGFFLAGIMGVYALSGMLLIFRNTDFLKQEKRIEKKLSPNLTEVELGEEIKNRDLKFESASGTIQNFKNGKYNTATGYVEYTTKTLPRALDKLTQLHKANTKQPLFFLNVFFGASLLFFVISSFWMFMPSTSIFKKGLYFTLAGILLTILLLII